MNEQPEQSFGPNKFTLSATVGLALFTQWCFYVLRGESGPTAHAVNLVVMACLLGLVVWLASIKVTLDPVGIHYRSLFFRKEMRWEDIEHCYCSVTRDGRGFSCRLVDERGLKLSFGGNRVDQPMILLNALNEFTYSPLVHKFSTRLYRGEKVSFGPVRLSRENGIQARHRVDIPGWGRMPWKATLEIGWTDGVSWQVENDECYLRRNEDKWIRIPRAKVANAHVFAPLYLWLHRVLTEAVELRPYRSSDAFLLSPLVLDQASQHGLPEGAVAGHLPLHVTQITKELFVPNPQFLSLLHEVVALHGPSLFVKDPANLSDGLFRIFDLRAPDLRDPGLGGQIEMEDVIGHFDVRAGEIVPDSYRPNPEYLLVGRRGPFVLGQELKNRLIERLLGMNAQPKSIQ